MIKTDPVIGFKVLGDIVDTEMVFRGTNPLHKMGYCSLRYEKQTNIEIARELIQYLRSTGECFSTWTLACHVGEWLELYFSQEQDAVRAMLVLNTDDTPQFKPAFAF